MDKKKTVNIDMKQYGMVLALIAVFLIFAVMTGGKNMSPANINNLSDRQHRPGRRLYRGPVRCNRRYPDD